MQDLKKHEQFELEVLERLNSARLLNRIVFCGGTMLRLCHGLDRYSADLDFWLISGVDHKKLFHGIKECLEKYYSIKDAADKHFTLLFEIRSPKHPRSLKIELRKGRCDIKTELVIAYSAHADVQVLLRAVSLKDMMRAKTEAFLGRGEIRDVYDMEFLLKKGIGLKTSKETLKAVIKNIDSLIINDYKIKLGSLLEAGRRKYYQEKNFSILKTHIDGLLNDHA